MLTALLATLVMSAQQGGPLVCPVAGDAASKAIAASDYRGVRFYYCCGGCNTSFEKNPEKYLKADSNKGKTIGESLFDPVSGLRVVAEDVKATTDYDGVRFVFSSEANKAKFMADPKAFCKIPEKEVLYCSVMGHGIANYSEAGGYTDYESVRYYTCCGDCLAKLKASPATFAAKVKDKVAAPKAFPVKAKG